MIEILRVKKDDYKFMLKSESGTILLNSMPFKSEKKTRQIVKSLGSVPQRQSDFERKTSHTGKFLFNLKNQSGEVIGVSQNYSSEAGMENGIQNLKTRIVQLSHQGDL